MRRFLNRLVARLVLLYFVVFSGTAGAQGYSQGAVKAELTVRFINYFSWEQEEREGTFGIAFIGTDPEYYNHLKQAVSNRLIRGKAVKLTAIDTMEDMEKYHMLVVAANTRLSFSEIALKARGTNTLVVSDGESDRIYIMINLLLTADNTVTFELNRANVILENLSVSNDMLLLGGAELDVANLYREMEGKLSRLAESLDETRTQSSLVNTMLSNNQTQLSNARTKLLDTQLVLQAVTTTLARQEEIVVTQEEIIKSRQIKLALVSKSAAENAKLLAGQSETLKQYSAEILHQGERVSQNETLLRAQESELVDQKSSIERQSGIIRDQNQLLYFFFGVLVLFLMLVFWIVRVSRDRKRMSIELEKRGDVLEEEVRARTAELILSESHYRALSELSPVGVYQIDAQGSCRYVNERWCEYSGLTRREAMGSGWIAALHPEDRKRLSSQWALNLRPEGLLNSEYRFRSPDGDIRWLFGQCEAEYDTNGVLQGYIGTVTDITSQRHLQEQLRRKLKLDALGTMTGGIAHDYNNMLGIISGFADLLKGELTTQPTLLNFVDQIIHASERGAVLTKKLLTFSRHNPSDAKMININTLLESQHEMLEKTLTPRINLKLILEEDLWPVWLDEGDLEDALVNVSINAMHAIEGNGNLTIEVKNHHVRLLEAVKLSLKPGDYVVLSLTDTGGGMDEETKEKLFDPFYTTKGTQGTGLGLTQVYRFVQRSKGGTRVDSTLGKGTKFSFYFPRYIDAGVADDVEPERATGNLTGSETVLIADDEAALLELASRILNDAGYKTICVSNGREALDVLKETPIDLLLSDVVMPELGGYELANAVQRLYPATRIQLVSGFTDLKERQDVDKYLLQNVINKPYRAQYLLQRVRQLLDQGIDPMTQPKPSAGSIR